MKTKIKLLLATFVFALCVQVFAEDVYSENAEDVKGIKKCLTVKNLNVCNNATIQGTLTVNNVPMNPSGLLAYGFAYDTSETVLAGGDLVPFSNVSNPSSGVILPAPGGTTFTVESAGVYEISFTVAVNNASTPLIVPASTLAAFGVVDVNSSVILNGSIFASNIYIDSSSPNNIIPAHVNGSFLVSLAAGQQIALKKMPGAPLALISQDGSDDASFVIKRIS